MFVFINKRLRLFCDVLYFYKGLLNLYVRSIWVDVRWIKLNLVIGDLNYLVKVNLFLLRVLIVYLNRSIILIGLIL